MAQVPQTNATAAQDAHTPPQDSDSPVHCVLCHEDYLPRLNAKMACQIRHQHQVGRCYMGRHSTEPHYHGNKRVWYGGIECAGCAKDADDEEKEQRGTGLRIRPQSHCILCHQNYIPSRNRHGACRVSHASYEAGHHPFREEYEYIRGYYTFSRACCGEEIRSLDNDGPSADDLPNTWCYRGRHSTERHYHDFPGRKRVQYGLIECSRSDCEIQDDEI
ncbi:hypothetical protein C8R43DRAFT_1133082 [Mycena crocata]|nr:hypothetical protein C8R43DRAFT_1133082 [Mycena crocata]